MINLRIRVYLRIIYIYLIGRTLGLTSIKLLLHKRIVEKCSHVVVLRAKTRFKCFSFQPRIASIHNSVFPLRSLLLLMFQRELTALELKSSGTFCSGDIGWCCCC